MKWSSRSVFLDDIFLKNKDFCWYSIILNRKSCMSDQYIIFTLKKGWTSSRQKNWYSVKYIVSRWPTLLGYYHILSNFSVNDLNMSAVYLKAFLTTQDIQSCVTNKYTGPNQILSDRKIWFCDQKLSDIFLTE